MAIRIKLLFFIGSFFLLAGGAFGQPASPNPLGPFADSIERRRAEQDLRSLPQKLRDQIERNLSDPRTLRQMNEDFLRIQAIREDLAKAFSGGSTLEAKKLRSSSTEIRKRATRLRSMLSLTENYTELEIDPDEDPTIASINRRAFDLCLEISRFTGNPLFKGKVIVIAHARDASRSLDSMIGLADILRRESSRLVR